MTEFPASLPDGVTLRGNGVSLRMTGRGHSARRVDEQTVAYTYDEKTTIEYALTCTGFKEDIVVSEYTGQTEYPFTLYTNGLELTNIDGGYYLTDNEGVIQASIGEIIVFTADERNNTLGTLRVAVVEPGQEYALTIVLEADYLADPKTVYPIRIDPTVELVYTSETPNAIEEKTLQSNSTTSGSNTATVIGKNSNGISRTIMKFPGLDFDALQGVIVTSAVVTLRDLMCESEAMTITCYPFTGGTWTESSTQWADLTQSWGEALSSNVISYSSGKQQTVAHRYRFDITALAQQWVDWDADEDLGIIFRSPDSVENGTESFYKTFATSERASYKPTFEITYKYEGTPDSSVYDVDEGSTITLTTTFPADQTVTWSTEDAAVATVDQNGVVTGVNEGKTTITATCAEAAAPVPFTVYVTVADGIYYIKNAASELYLQASVDNAYMYSQKTDQSTRLNQLWKITYVANGRYVIRPLQDTSVIMTISSGGYVAVADAATSDESVATASRWSIVHDDSGYAFMLADSETQAVMPVVTGMSGSQVYSTTLTSSTACHWELEETNGVFLRDTTTLQIITSSTERYAELGQTCTLADLGLSCEHYGINTEYSWTSIDTSVATITSSGLITTVSRGTTQIKVSMDFDGTTNEQAFTLFSIKSVNLEAIYDQGYLAKYTEADNRVSTFQEELREYYLHNFYILVNFTAPQSFSSYADTCSFPYNEPCHHGLYYGSDEEQTECYTCEDSIINSDLTTELKPYHHKNVVTIIANIDFPTAEGTYKMAFTGHEVCRSEGGLCSRYNFNSNPVDGATIVEIRVALICAVGTTDNEAATVIHEFGHFFGAQDHYDKMGFPSTDTMNDKYGTNIFSSRCIYGEDYDTADIIASKTICAGCRSLMEEYIASNLEN